MKKILMVIIGIMLLTGCGNKDIEEKYENMQIGDKIESYQLDLRIYGKKNNKQVNRTLRIDNYKNEEYKIEENNNVYYILNNKTYKGIKDKENNEQEEMFPEFNESLNMKFEETTDQVFKDTNLILEGLNNIKGKKELENDIKGKELKLYESKLKDTYVKELLKALGFDTNYEDAKAKIYLDGDKVYKIMYTIDEININGSYFRINQITKSNLNFE